jgi:CxxC-x17-CxxC domain-containing protein
MGIRNRQKRSKHADFGVLPCIGKPAMEFTDRILECVDCGTEFVFTADEQVFFHDRQFKNLPKHCKKCKAKRVSGSRRVRPETRTNCSACGSDTTVPFKPTHGKPVLCRSCWQKQAKGLLIENLSLGSHSAEEQAVIAKQNKQIKRNTQPGVKPM